MTQVDPFAPPSAPMANAPPATGVAPVTEEELARARRALAQHCSRRASLDADAAAEGGRFAPVTLVGGGLLLASLLAVGAATAGLVDGAPEVESVAIFMGGLLAFIFGLVFLASLVNDLRVGRRASATEPARALSKWFLAARTGRKGYCFTALAPSARGQSVTGPTYGPEDTPPPPVALVDPKAMKDYLQTFARPGLGFVRWFRAKNLRLVRQDGDVAVVAVDLELTKWPQWANILSIVLFVVIRLIGIIVGLVLLVTLKKQEKMTIEKTLIQGPNGLWYLVDADLRR